MIRQVVTILLAALSGLSCTATRIALYNTPSTRDSRIFPCVELPVSFSPHVFAEAIRPDGELDRFLASHRTGAMLVLRGDSIVYSYFDPLYDQTTAFPLFSISKSYVAAMTGISHGRGEIECYATPVVRYLPEVADIIGPEATVLNLLNLRTHIVENGSTTALLYYSSDLSRDIHLTAYKPDTAFHYGNIPTQIETMLLERCTGRDFCALFTERLWLPLKPQDCGYWSHDSRRKGHVRGFCGLETSARDALKLGVLYRDGGRFEGRCVVPEEWIEQTLNPDVMTVDKDDACYSRHWYILTPGEEFFTVGYKGQYLYVDKPSGTVIIRTGTNDRRVDWIELFRTIAER